MTGNSTVESVKGILSKSMIRTKAQANKPPGLRPIDN
jgi:hypothetical protein